MQYTFIDEYGNILEKAPKLLDNTPYAVFWEAEAHSGVYVATGAQLKEWARAAEFYPRSIGVHIGRDFVTFDSLTDMLGCLLIRADAKLANALRDLPQAGTVALNPQLVESYSQWKSDFDEGRNWLHGWRTYFLKKDDRGVMCSFTGNDIWLDDDQWPDYEKVVAAEPTRRVYGEPENDNARMPWYVENIATGKHVYFITATRVMWQKESGRWYSEVHMGRLSEKSVKEIVPHCDEPAELLYIEVNHDKVWKAAKKD